MTGGVTAMILAAASAVAPAHDVQCAEIVRPLQRGAYPVEADLKSVSCPVVELSEQVVERAFWYDPRSGVLRASRDLSAHMVVAAPPPSLLAVLRPGDSLAIEARVGPVVVQRDVAVVRPARANKRIMVRIAGQAPFAVDPSGTGR